MFESFQKYMSDDERAEFLKSEPVQTETPKTKKRRYDGARLSRLTNDWTASATTANQILRMDLAQLRRRSRDLSRNDPYAKRFFQLVRTNVIGKGIQLQVHTSDGSKKRDAKLTSKVEYKFWQWAKKTNCTVSGKLSFVEALQLFVTQMSRDGESLVRMVADQNNPFGFSLKFYDADWLDENWSTTLPSGNRVIMSVEVDSNEKPIAYWLTEPVGNYPHSVRRREGRTRFRVDASEMIHSFIVTEGEDQSRGIPWLHASMLRMFMLYAFEEAELEGKRVFASQGVYLIPPVDLDVAAFEGDEETEEAAQLEDIEPGMQQVLKPGWDVKEFSPKVDTTVEGFRKSQLRGAGVGAGISYHTLAGDLEAVNYSSARIGSLEDRDMWREIQEKVISDFCEPIYKKWVEAAFLKGILEISYQDFQRIQEPTFRGRGWDWVDPAKDMSAHIEGLTNGIESLTEVLSEKGVDIEDHFDELKKVQDMAKEKGIELPWLMAKQETQNAKEDAPPKRNLHIV